MPGPLDSRFHKLLADLATEHHTTIGELKRENNMLRSKLAEVHEVQEIRANVVTEVDESCSELKANARSNGRKSIEFVEDHDRSWQVSRHSSINAAPPADPPSCRSSGASASNRSSTRIRHGDGIGGIMLVDKKRVSKQGSLASFETARTSVNDDPEKEFSKSSILGKLLSIDSFYQGKPEADIHMFDMGSLAKETVINKSDGHCSKTHCMLSPIGKPRMLWDILWSFSLAYDMWWSIFLLVFISDADDKLSTCKTLSLATMSFWICDIILNFNTGYIVGDRHVVYNRRVIAYNYARTWLLFDLVATFPFDKIAQSDSGSETFSMIRSSKATKAFKIIKIMKLLRMAKVLQMRKGSMFFKLEYWVAKTKAVSLPILGLVVGFTTFSHFHGSLWASTNPDWEPTSDSMLAFGRYLESFRWAYSAITFGTEVRSAHPPQALVEGLLSCERFLLACGLVYFAALKALAFFQQRTKVFMGQDDFASYLKRHDVPAETQIEVMFSLHETAHARISQQNFNIIVAELPLELRRTISKELWAPRLFTLELFVVADSWHDDFVVEVAQFVKEEVYATKAIVCREGDPAIAAYCVLKGKIRVRGWGAPSGLSQPWARGVWGGWRRDVGFRRFCRLFRCSPRVDRCGGSRDPPATHPGPQFP